MTRVRGAGLLIGISAIIVLAAALLWYASVRDGASLSLDTAPSTRLLSRLADDAGLSATAQGPVTRVPVDGTTADTADRQYTVPAIEPARAALIKACGKQQLAAPTEELRRMMPDIACAGRWDGKDATVHLTGQCGKTCLIVVETRII